MSYRYRAYPDPAQVEGLAGHSAQARCVWNLACEQQGWHAPGGARRCRPPGAAVRMRQLAAARAAFDWLAAGSSNVQQQALRDYDQAGCVNLNWPHRDGVGSSGRRNTSRSEGLRWSGGVSGGRTRSGASGRSGRG